MKDCAAHWIKKREENPPSSLVWLASNNPTCQITQLCQSQMWLIILTCASFFFSPSLFQAENFLPVWWVIRHAIRSSFQMPAHFSVFFSHKITCLFGYGTWHHVKRQPHFQLPRVKIDARLTNMSKTDSLQQIYTGRISEYQLGGSLTIFLNFNLIL